MTRGYTQAASTSRWLHARPTLVWTEVCFLERLVKPTEVPHECIESAQVQHYLGPDKPTLNMEGFDMQAETEYFCTNYLKGNAGPNQLKPSLS
ncbi:hypothetical protein WISP_105904 [Willisornis vidua]|uniref:Uncharacterized protein n=1 Tax=Willisornis vidua TaxID=1566151 RepID=A0ABQ9D2B9_9PASS|nr:hypothetical protein WISP_105904 [Willisornis vidua]